MVGACGDSSSEPPGSAHSEGLTGQDPNSIRLPSWPGPLFTILPRPRRGCRVTLGHTAPVRCGRVLTALPAPAPSGVGLCSSGCVSAASHSLLGTACEVGAGLPLLPKQMIQRSGLAKGHTAQRGGAGPAPAVYSLAASVGQGRGVLGRGGDRRSLRGLGASRVGEAREGTNFLPRWPVSSHCSHPGSQHCGVGASSLPLAPPPAPFPQPQPWSSSLGRWSQ